MRVRFRSRRRSTRRFRNLDLQRDLGRLHINISGCINACGHHHVGHIGILGVEKNGEEVYQITLGGKADEDAKLGALIGPAVPYAQVADVVEDIAQLISNCGSGLTSFSSTQSSVSASSHSGSGSMPLVENGRIVEDRYVRVADDAPIPDRTPVLVSAKRFLAEANELVRRDGSLGVLWPNDRRVASSSRGLAISR